MYTCANCAVVACGGEDRSKLPANCPMRDQENLEEILKTYEEPENHKFYVGDFPRRRRESAKTRRLTLTSLNPCAIPSPRQS